MSFRLLKRQLKQSQNCNSGPVAGASQPIDRESIATKNRGKPDGRFHRNPRRIEKLVMELTPDDPSQRVVRCPACSDRFSADFRGFGVGQTL
jgi:hypothetical protein